MKDSQLQTRRLKLGSALTHTHTRETFPSSQHRDSSQETLITYNNITIYANNKKTNDHNTTAANRHTLNATPLLAIRDDIQPVVLKGRSQRHQDAGHRTEYYRCLADCYAETFASAREKVQVSVLQ